MRGDGWRSMARMPGSNSFSVAVSRPRPGIGLKPLRGSSVHSTMKRATLVTFGLLLAAPLSAAELWVHFHAEELDARRSRVVVNLPVRALEKALPLIPADIEATCDMRLNGSRVRPEELRAAIAQLRVLPAGTEVPLPEEGLTVRRGTDTLVFTSQGRWSPDAHGSLTVPIDLAEALLGREGELDLRGAIQLLIRRGEGEIAMIDNQDQRVRIWVDSSPVAPLRVRVVSAGK